MNEAIIICVTANLSLATLAQERRGNGEACMHRFSTTVEKERPQLNEETKRLIALCRRDPTEENLAALRHQVAANYDAVVARKKAKLEELKRHQSKIDDAQPAAWRLRTMP